MYLPDLNVLIGAFRADAPRHEELRRWVHDTIASGDIVGLTPAVSAGVVRILTDRRIHRHPDAIDDALEHIDVLRANPNVVDVVPGPQHWSIFARLCEASGATGNLVADAAHAAVAIEHGATWVTLDGDFARFPGLRWMMPGGRELRN